MRVTTPDKDTTRVKIRIVKNISMLSLDVLLNQKILPVSEQTALPYLTHLARYENGFLAEIEINNKIDYHTSNINPTPIKRHIKSRLACEMIRKGKRKKRRGVTDLLDTPEGL
ncbi:hypothetical protein ABRQ05_16190 [Pectobacterium actinidiae]|uniref:hypothetical protein n=1 Tax=Pectobacterium actinidiae TaxID=1507808 RepID=UPI0032EFCCE8